MSPILRELADLRRPEAVRALSRRIGAPEDAASRALAASVPTLLSVFARMSSSPRAVDTLLASHGGERGALGDLPAALGSPPPGSAEAILDAALGERRTAVTAQIARAAGVGPLQAGAVLAAAAALLVEALQRVRRRRCWSAEELTRTLAREIVLAEDAVPGSVGVLEELLESAADAELGDDITEVGAQLLQRLCEG